MKLRDGQLRLSPTDLSYFLACRHRAARELWAASGGPPKPQWDDPLLEALIKLGEAHEKQYVDHLRARSHGIVDLTGTGDPHALVTATLEAMRDGADVIVQGALANGRWYGRPDILRKTSRPSPVLGDWSYEVADTKLARETRGGTILQLGLYCEMLAGAQGLAPDRFYVVTPPDEETEGAGGEAQKHVVRPYRMHDFAAYFRLLKAQFEEAMAEDPEALAAANYPEPVEHCDICPWSPGCAGRRRKDDHLSLVAGMSRLQRRELAPFGVTTVEALGGLGDPFPYKPKRGALETYARVRDQARLQVKSRNEGRIVWELIELPYGQPARIAEGEPEAHPPERSEGARADRVSPKRPEGAKAEGLARLPAPSPGDVFLDLEGDPLAGSQVIGSGPGGREYLFGLVDVHDDGEVRYRPRWAEDAAGERRAFEAVMDLITSRLADDPGMHVYHYAPYEPSAFKRLMGRYATREDEVDRLLRAGRFVDLYAVVRQSVRAGVERYSIKSLEPLYEFQRQVDLRDANRALRVMEQALELDAPDLATPEVRTVVEGYNRDDCVSTLLLRDWLEARRDELVARGINLPRPAVKDDAPPEELDEKAKHVEALRAKLLDGVPDDPKARTPDQQARFLAAYLLDFHRREDKAGWWEYYRLSELPEEDLLEEPRAVAGLEYVGDVEQRKKSVVQRFRYPEQEFDIRPTDNLKTQDGKTFAERAKIVAIDRDARTLDLLVGPSKLALRPSALFAHKYIDPKDIAEALFEFGERVEALGGVSALPAGPRRSLLLREAPALTTGSFAPPAPAAGQSVTDYAVSLVTGLDRTALAIQGPPGSGKTYTGARMILEAVRAGLRVGVTGPSHKVIRNLLHAVHDAPGAAAADVRLGHKCGDDEELGETGGVPVAEFAANDEAAVAIGTRQVNVLGGTAWLWARPEFATSVDILFVDEAGQMSLANTLAIARAASSLVLLGDPQQLDQPMKGSHPDGVGVSALQHVLGEAQTMPVDRGLFLPITWRLAPAICQFTSELFYASGLHSKPGLEHQVLAGNVRFEGAGLWFVPVEHDGNRSASDEEAAAVARIVAELLAPASTWIDEAGKSHRMTATDLRVVAPFNAHAHRIREALAAAASGAAAGGAAAGGTAAGGAPGLQPRGIPVGTVDKFQGQEAPVVIYSMATSRPEDAPRGLEFLYSLNRLNVATSRARCAAILVASPRLLEPECRTPHQMRLANALCRFREMAQVRARSGTEAGS